MRNFQFSNRRVVHVLLMISIIWLVFVPIYLTQNYEVEDEFLKYWYYTRDVIFKGKNPYIDEQVSVNFIDDTSRSKSIDSEGEDSFNLPLVSLVVLTPIALIDKYSIARIVWGITNGLILLTIILSISILCHNKKPTNMFWFGFILALVSPITFRTIQTGSIIFFQLLFLFLSIKALRDERDIMAGILVSLVIIGGNILISSTLPILIWSFFNKRMNVFKGAIASIGILVTLSILVTPDWLISYIRMIAVQFGSEPFNYLIYSVRRILPGIATVLAYLGYSIAFLVILFETWRLKDDGIDVLTWTTNLFLIIISIVGSDLDSPLRFVTIPIAFYLWLVMLQRRKIINKPLIDLLLFIVVIFIVINNIFLDIYIIKIISTYVFSPIILLILMYWFRWWATRERVLTAWG